MIVSTAGPVSPLRPISSSAGTRLLASRPSPPRSAGTSAPVTPAAASLRHTAATWLWSPPGQPARTTSGVTSLASSPQAASRSAAASSLSSNRTARAYALGRPSSRSATTLRCTSFVPA